MTFLNTPITRSTKRLFTTTALITVVSFGLGACESSKSKYGLSAPSSTASLSKATKGSKSKKSSKHHSKKSARKKSVKVALAPIGGLPKKLSKSFAASLKRAIKAENIKSASASRHKIKGYFAATPQKGKTKVSYVLDITNKAGKRIKRIHGKQLVKGDPKDPWKNVSKSVLNKIALRTAATLSATLTGGKPIQTADRMPSESENDNITKTSAPAATASIASTAHHIAKMSAIIPAVEGAPGDGKISLTRAITKQLKAKGIKIETIQAPGVHSVKGYVSLKSLDAQQDQITIKWLVFNSKGRRLGIVSQKNTIAKGSLNGAWGRIAHAAAGAAAKGIRKLLPNKSL